MKNSIALQRLISQKISRPEFQKPEDTVKHLLAMQAQDYGGALWSIGLRTKGCTQADVEKAIADRKIVRTWPMRGTLHCVHADDVHWLLDLLAPRATAAAKTRRLSLGLTDEVMGEAEKIIREALTGGKYVRRDELMRILSAKVSGIVMGNNQAGHIFRNFGERGIVCFGPHDGKQPTFVLLDEWVSKGETMDHETALGQLAERYFASHGPALVTDLAGWAGITMGDARKGLEHAGKALVSTEIEGKLYYHTANIPKTDDASAAQLLPGFDEYILGYKDRSAVLTAEHSAKIVPGGNGMFLPTILVDGQVVGTWKRTVKKTGVDIRYIFFDKVYSEKLFQAAADRYKRFLSVAGN